MNNTQTENLVNITLSPWIQKSTRLIGKPRKVGGNQFRHQGATFFILLDYKYIDPVLLKASLIHDLFEDFDYHQDYSEFTTIDSDGPAVVDLVLEVSRRKDKTGRKESKSEFLNRIATTGSRKAKILKCADRISNITDLNSDLPGRFYRKYIKETETYILPMAKGVDRNMVDELKDQLKQLKGKWWRFF